MGRPPMWIGWRSRVARRVRAGGSLAQRRFHARVRVARCPQAGASPRSSPGRPRRGVALVSTLLIVALASALAYQMVERHALTIAHARQTFDGAQAREYLLGAEQFARQLLHDDWQDDDTRAADTLLEDWAAPDTPFAIEGGQLRLSIVDLDGRLNLNGVVGDSGPDNLERFRCLLTNLGLEPNVADAWLDWVDEDGDVHGFGAEDDTYLMADPAYRAANRQAAGASELLAITGAETFEAVRPHVAATPARRPRINVNTAGYEVLRCLNLSEDAAERLVESEREYDDVAAVAADYAALGASVGALAVQSEFFQVAARVELSGARAQLTSLLHRDPTSGAVRLLARDFGRRFEVPADSDGDTRS